MLEIFSYVFLQRALVAGLVIALVAPTIGLFFVVRRYSAIADTLAHISLAGVAVSLFAGTMAIPTALVVTIASVFGMERLREKKTLPPETILTLFLFGGLSVAVVLLGLSRNKNVSLTNYLFGSILTVSSFDLILITLLGALVFVLVQIFWRHFFFVSIDEDAALASGLPVKRLNRLMSILGAVTIAISMNVVGVLLVGAMMVIPVLAAMQFKRGFRETWYISLVAGVLSVIAGLFGSFYLNIASGGSIVLCAIGLFLLASIANSTLWNRQSLT